MALETHEIPALTFWLVTLGASIYVTTILIKKVGDKVSEVFK